MEEGNETLTLTNSGIITVGTTSPDSILSVNADPAGSVSDSNLMWSDNTAGYQYIPNTFHPGNMPNYYPAETIEQQLESLKLTMQSVENLLAGIKMQLAAIEANREHKVKHERRKLGKNLEDK